jgi:hypothetical protein
MRVVESLCQRTVHQYRRQLLVSLPGRFQSSRQRLLRWQSKSRTIFQFFHFNIILPFSPDIDECESVPCFNGECINTHGSYECECLPGYFLQDDSCLGWSHTFPSTFQDLICIFSCWCRIATPPQRRGRMRRKSVQQRHLHQHSRLVPVQLSTRLHPHRFSFMFRWHFELCLRHTVQSYF